jgi:outer membrane protein assembly factor BamE (lipoprotein component of BamABCDE complex)
MRNGLLIYGLCFLAACQPRVNSRGNVIVEENFNSFVVGKTTTDDVLEKCGTPSLHKDNYSWIYVGSKVEEDAFNEVKSTHEFIVKMTFDHNKILRSIDKIDSGKRADLSIDEEITSLITDRQANLKVNDVLNKARD